jgi:hypothetical protein
LTDPGFSYILPRLWNTVPYCGTLIKSYINFEKEAEHRHEITVNVI